MRICLAQIESFKADLFSNLKKHEVYIQEAIKEKADLIIFPELSLTGYHAALGKELSELNYEKVIREFQLLSDQQNIVIGAGVPTASATGVQISMLIIQPNKKFELYSKQFLHLDELPFFDPGEIDVYINMEYKIAPAICYESLLEDHSTKAMEAGAEVYLCSVAKSASGIRKAYNHYPKIAKDKKMWVMMANSVGYSDTFENYGCSAVWDKNGKLVDQLDNLHEGILLIDTDTKETVKRLFNEGALKTI